MTGAEANASEAEPGDPEVALRRILDMAMAGDGPGFLDSITSEAYVDILHILPNLGEGLELTSYKVELLDGGPGEHRFRVSLLGEDTELAPTVTVSKVKQVWKLAAIKLAGVRD
ncbi:MAG: hypothetical protein WD178_04325 [Actinomycetota bacterium]